MSDLQQGDVAWAWLDPTTGREQSGRRPVVVVSSARFHQVVTTLVVVVPVTRTDRGWANHVPVTGVPGLQSGFAMTEQPRTLSRERLSDPFGTVDPHCLSEVRQWLADFLDLA